MTPPERLQDVTLAEVVAEMRKAAAGDGYNTAMIVRWADRIEAAAALSVRGDEPDSLTWTQAKPTRSGVYGVRGFEFGVPAAQQFEAVVMVREYEGELVCNLHEETSNSDFEDWSPIADLNDKFEWARFAYAAPPATPPSEG